MAQRPKLNRIWGGSTATTRRDPGDTKYNQGWVSEIPTYQVLNYLQWKADTTMLAIAERGVAEWGADVTYRKGSLVWDETNATIYVAIVNAPTAGTKPSSNSPHWSASSIQVTRAGYDTTVSNINTHIANRTTNPHGLTADMLNAYNKAQIDALVTQYNALVKAHTDRRDNPHDVTASQIGAVPVTGGTYTGDVTFNTGLYFNTAKTAKLFVNAAGNLALQNGGTTLGVTTAGKAYVSSGAASSNIVLESGFAALKALREPDYAVPLPTFQMNLIGSINVQVGASGVDSGTWVPTYNANNNALLVDNVGAQKTISADSPTLAAGTAGVTIAVDILQYANTGTVGWAVYAGTDDTKITVNGANQIVAEGGGTSAVWTASGVPVGTWYRAVAVFGNGAKELYVNGVLLRRDVSTINIPQSTARIRVSEPSAGNVSTTRLLRNLRIWDSALTAQQVSTL